MYPLLYSKCLHILGVCIWTLYSIYILSLVSVILGHYPHVMIKMQKATLLALWPQTNYQQSKDRNQLTSLHLVLIAFLDHTQRTTSCLSITHLSMKSVSSAKLRQMSKQDVARGIKRVRICQKPTRVPGSFHSISNLFPCGGNNIPQLESWKAGNTNKPISDSLRMSPNPHENLHVTHA